MSTPQVPGYVASNNDALHDGCWAERVHASGATQYLYIDRIEGSLIRYHEFIPGPVTAAPAVRVMTLQGFGGRVQRRGLDVARQGGAARGGAGALMDLISYGFFTCVFGGAVFLLWVLV